ncbi:MAG: threonine--tRNA ligase [Phycisphaerae bacterium]|nr:threonine--tRNA ligase [Phycisphaerae bacterium]
MLTVTLPDGSQLSVAEGATAGDVAAQIGPRLAKVAIAAVVNGETVDLNQPLHGNCGIELLTPKADDDRAMAVMRHSCAHVMAEAICRLFPNTKLVYGPAVENGFYYDIDLDRPLTPDDFEAIEKAMEAIVREDKPFTRVDLSRADAMPKLQAEGNRYKVDNAERADGDCLSFYVTGTQPGADFEDLCRGPHVPSTGRIGAFKIMQVSGAFYRGDPSEKQLQRVYGTTWPDKKALKAYLDQLEEAKKRDHRRIGTELGLYVIDPQVGPGMVLWKPKGAVLRKQLEEFILGELVKQGYKPVYCPHVGRLDLYRTSGHYPYYKDSQFAPIRMPDGEELLLKPMNCPHHIKIFQSDPHSYRDLPVRFAEFGTVYRYEQSGELAGMTRVRGFTQDDAHIFCTPEQLPQELDGCLRLVRLALETLGLKDYRVRLGLRDPASDKYIGGDAVWAQAEEAVRSAARNSGLRFSEEAGEAAFYGPKIDFVVRDCIGREWQLGTVQVDYNLPERFGLEYVGSDNAPHRPVMIHRAPFGSFERFVAILIEHFAGAFPLWLAPVQVAVLSISEKSAEYAQQVHGQLCDAGLRSELDVSAEKIGPKKHAARQQKVPYIVVVGEQEAQAGTVNVNDRDGKTLGTFALAEFIGRCQEEVRTRTLSS